MRIFRNIKLLWQKLTRGDSDTWSLDYTVSKFTLPKLKRLKEVDIYDWEENNKKEDCIILDEIIWLHETIVSRDTLFLHDEPQGIRFKRALRLWGEYYTALWW